VVLKTVVRWFRGESAEVDTRPQAHDIDPDAVESWEEDLWAIDEDEPETGYGRVGVCRDCRRIIKDSDRWGDGSCKECEG
jgi:hypothetical protein